MYLNESFGYSNIFELRTHKLRLMKQLIDIFPHRSVIAHMDKVEGAPQRFVQDVVKQFNVTLANRVEKQSNKLHQHVCLNEREWKLAQKSIDWDVEALFGFTRLDCHMCE